MNNKFDFWNLGRGLLMGGADIIPGVSGGTVALILGIYERLVTAVSHFDFQLVNHLRRREWKAAMEHIDVLFLIPLGMGIALGMGGLASLMDYLLNHQLQYTFAVFFGLILGSSYLVWRMLPGWRILDVLLMLAGLVGMWFLVGEQFMQHPPDGNLYLFFCGMIAISAMILPGISGSFILLMLGKYQEVLGKLTDLLKGNVTGENLTSVLIFCCGCAVGLLGFSKFLRWLLKNHHSATLAVLCGVMIGSLRKLWPFSTDLTPEVKEFKLKQFAARWPADWGTSTWITLALMVSACTLVVLLEWFATRQDKADFSDDDELPKPASA